MNTKQLKGARYCNEEATLHVIRGELAIIPLWRGRMCRQPNLLTRNVTHIEAPDYQLFYNK